MIRKWIRNWLYPENTIEVRRRDVPLMAPAQYDPEAWFFTIKPADNGYIITFRVYDEKNPKVQNAYNDGPGYTDKIRLVHQNDNLVEALGVMLVQEAFKK